jgi:hypothetical protein
VLPEIHTFPVCGLIVSRSIHFGLSYLKSATKLQDTANKSRVGIATLKFGRHLEKLTQQIVT